MSLIKFILILTFHLCLDMLQIFTIMFCMHFIISEIRSTGTAHGIALMNYDAWQGGTNTRSQVVLATKLCLQRRHHLWVTSMGLVSCHISGAYNSEILPNFLEICAHLERSINSKTPLSITNGLFSAPSCFLFKIHICLILTVLLKFIIHIHRYEAYFIWKKSLNTNVWPRQITRVST